MANFQAPLSRALCFAALGFLSTSAPRAETLTGASAYGDYKTDAPGVRRLISPDLLPSPLASPPAANPPTEAARPAGAKPIAPAGFQVDLIASGLKAPRTLKLAPNGDVFAAETRAGRILILRPDHKGGYEAPQVYAEGLRGVFGMVFVPKGPDAFQFYVATTTDVLRFEYHTGDLKPPSAPQIFARGLASGGHTTRDLALSPNGQTLYVSVGSASNIAEGMTARPSGMDLAAFESSHLRGATWGEEENRADVLAFDLATGARKIFATGLRNCAGLTIEPKSGDLWCAVNERDLLGDDLPPDYATRVHAGQFFGWPWYYIGAHEDPRLRGQRPDLAQHVKVPDVLFQPHSAPLQIIFYDAQTFPADFRGNAFVTLHGSWNRAKRTGYKVVRIVFKNGQPTGEYEDFLTGFVSSDTSVWGRPVGVAVDKDGALLVCEDANGTIWRVSATRQ